MSTVKDIPAFGRRVKARREKIKLTPTEVAERLGVALATYCNVEEGRHLPSLPVYRKLCRVLRVSPGELLKV